MNLRFSLIVVLITLLGLAKSLTAAQTPATSPDPATLLARIKGLTEQLDLTPDQKAQIDDIFKRTADDLQAAMQDLQGASQEDKAGKFREILGDLRQQIAPILTDDQKAELREKLQNLRSPSTQPASINNGEGSPAPQSTRQGVGPNGNRPGGTPAAPSGGPAGRGLVILQRLKNALDQLALSPDQQTQVDQLFTDARQQFQTIRSAVGDGSMDRDVARQQMLAIFASGRARLASILTPDQQDKLHQILPFNPVSPGTTLADRTPGAGLGTAPRGKPTLAPAHASPTEAATVPTPPTASSSQAPAVGQAAPDFSLKTLDFNAVNLAAYKHKVLVLVFASYTNPSFRDRAAGLEALREQYGAQGANFLIIYTSETHPAGGWEVARNKTDGISITQPTTQAQRNQIAVTAKSALNLSIDVAPDTMDNKTATAYAVGDGTPAYVIGRDGKILFHQSWLEPMALEEAIVDALK